MIVKLKPYPDELLFSFIHRLADANALSINLFRQKYLNDSPKNRMLYDVRNGFPILSQALFPNQNHADKYFELSTAPFEALFLTSKIQSRLISNVFESYDEINRPIAGFIPELRICHHCIKEDREKYGEAYLHRAHQLSGVEFCHKHQVRLMKYTGKKGNELDYDSENYQIDTTPPQFPLEYTQYAYEIFTSGISANLQQIQSALLKKAFEFGMYSVKDDNEYFHFDNDKHPYIPKEIFYSEYASTARFLSIAMYFFPEASEFIAQFPKQNNLAREYVCSCGAKYYQGIWGYEKGLRVCPCRPYKDAHEKFIDMVQAIHGDEYQVRDKFTAMNTRVSILHKTCGTIDDYLPRTLLFGTARCSCQNIVTYQEAKSKINRIPGFKLIQFNGTNRPVTIRATRCGHQFECNYHKFLQSANCRVCHPSITTPEGYEERVRMLVGDEYTIITPFTSQRTKMHIRHNVCGHVQEYTPSHFLAGQRCKQCTKLTTRDKLDNYLQLYSNGRYKIISSEENLVVIHDTEFNKLIKLTAVHTMQEILRPTPSDILPVDNPNKSIHVTSAWEDALELFKEYVASNPVTSITGSTCYKEFGLGVWVKRQRIAYNRNGLSQDSIEKLEKAGFIFDKQNDVWMEKYNILKEIWGTEPINRDTVYNGVLIGSWLKNQRTAFTKGQLSWDRIDLMQQIDRNILESPKSKKKDPISGKHVRISYDNITKTILLKTDRYLDISRFGSIPVKWVFRDGISYLQFNPNKADIDDFERLRRFFEKNKYTILIKAEDFYEFTQCAELNAPDSYDPNWCIDNGIMYTMHSDIIQYILSPSPYNKPKC